MHYSEVLSQRSPEIPRPYTHTLTVEWILMAVAVALVVAVSLAPRRRKDDTAAPTPDQELNDIFAAVDSESSAAFIHMLHVRTHELIGRKVPVRDIRAAPTQKVARIAFSNGDIVLATSQTPGDLGLMAKAMLVTSVTLSGLTETEHGPMLRFVWNYGHVLDVFAVGLDQAD